MSATEVVVLVDTNDNELGVADKLEAHKQGLLHRAFSVFVVRKGTNDDNSDGLAGVEILLQQREHSKYHCGGLWTNTCCSHPRPNENTIDAAKRRLQEEMGFDLQLHNLGSFIYKAHFTNGLTEYELDYVLIGSYNHEIIKPNSEEVIAWKWESFKNLEQDLSLNSHIYTPWLKGSLEILKGNDAFILNTLSMKKEM